MIYSYLETLWSTRMNEIINQEGHTSKYLVSLPCWRIPVVIFKALNCVLNDFVVTEWKDMKSIMFHTAIKYWYYHSFFRISYDCRIFIFLFNIQFIRNLFNFLFILLGNISLLTIRRHSWQVWNIHWPYNWFKLNFQHLNKSFLCLKYLCVLWLFLFYTC